MKGTGFPNGQKVPWLEVKGSPQFPGFALWGAEKPSLSPRSLRQAGPIARGKQVALSKRGQTQYNNFLTNLWREKAPAEPEDARSTLFISESK